MEIFGINLTIPHPAPKVRVFCFMTQVAIQLSYEKISKNICIVIGYNNFLLFD
jgi:hypothetical protein